MSTRWLGIWMVFIPRRGGDWGLGVWRKEEGGEGRKLWTEIGWIERILEMGCIWHHSVELLKEGI